MPEIYADWESLEPLTAPVPVGTKCVVVDRDIGDRFDLGEIVTVEEMQQLPWCKNTDGIMEIFRVSELALLPADYQAESQAEPKAEPAKVERKVVHGFYGIDRCVYAICNDGSMWYLGCNGDQWRKRPPIPQD